MDGEHAMQLVLERITFIIQLEAITFKQLLACVTLLVVPIWRESL